MRLAPPHGVSGDLTVSLLTLSTPEAGRDTSPDQERPSFERHPHPLLPSVIAGQQDVDRPIDRILYNPPDPNRQGEGLQQ